MFFLLFEQGKTHSNSFLLGYGCGGAKTGPAKRERLLPPPCDRGIFLKIFLTGKQQNQILYPPPLLTRPHCKIRKIQALKCFPLHKREEKGARRTNQKGDKRKRFEKKSISSLTCLPARPSSSSARRPPMTSRPILPLPLPLPLRRRRREAEDLGGSLCLPPPQELQRQEQQREQRRPPQERRRRRPGPRPATSSPGSAR